MKPEAPTCSEPSNETLHLARILACAECIDSATLLGNRDEVEISHGSETYRLRRTRQGKLILTK